MDAAVLLFTQFGVRSTTMEQIAKQAKVGKGTLYLYFADKAALFKTVMERKWRDMNREVERRLPANGPILDKLVSMLQSVTGFRERDPFFAKIHMEYVHFRTEEIELGLRQAQNEAIQVVEKLVRSGIEAGELPDVPPGMLAFLLVKGFAAFSHEWPDEFGPMDEERMIALFRTLLQGR